MKKQFLSILFAVLFCINTQAQAPVPSAPDWSLKVSSNVEKDGRGLAGASVVLYRGSRLLRRCKVMAMVIFK